jgi:large subunit ribosomal protein L43
VNGNGYFHPSICKLTLYYNTPRPGAGGDSVGMIKYIKKNLPELGKSRPYVEIVLAARSGPPEISAFYNCGDVTSIKTSKWKANEIHQQVEHLCDTSGPASTARHLPRNVKKGTGSLIDKVKPIWTPFYAKEIFKP